MYPVRSRPPRGAPPVDAWFVLPDDLHAPRAAREVLAAHCPTLGEPERDDLALLVTELVTNAVTHGRPDVALHLVVSALLVRVDVFDRGAPVTHRRPAPVPVTHGGGRGLAIVDSLATRWGTTPAAGPRGKSVWFELRLATAS